MGKRKNYKIIDGRYVEQIPTTKEGMVEAFLKEQDRLRYEYKFIAIASDELINKVNVFNGEIAKERLKLLQREKNAVKREKDNIAFARSINKLYPGSIIFTNPEDDIDDD